jgi:hypothetical protein
MYRNPVEMVNALANAYPVDFLGAKEIDPRVKYFEKGVTTNKDIREEYGLLRVEEFRKKTDKNIVDLSLILPYIEAMTRFLEKNREREDNGHVNFDPPEGFVGKINWAWAGSLRATSRQCARKAERSSWCARESPRCRESKSRKCTTTGRSSARSGARYP